MNKTDDRDARGAARTGTGDATETSTEALLQQIDNTRSELGQTLSVIEQKLHPTTLREKAVEELQVVEERVKDAVKEQFAETKAALKVELIEAKDNVKKDVLQAVTQAKQALRAATIGKVQTMARRANETTVEARDSLLDTLWQNPLPTALLGVGLTWLYMNHRGSSGRSERSRNDYDSDGWRRPAGAQGAYGGAESYGPSVLESAQDTAGKVVHSAQRKVSDLASAAGDAASQATRAAGNVAHDAADAAGRLVHQVSEGASHFAHDAGEMGAHLAGQAHRQVGRVDQTVRATLHTNPLAVGAAVLAAGALVGLALPRTHKEDDIMGEARDRLVDRARDAAHDAVEAARQTAERGANELRDAASRAART